MSSFQVHSKSSWVFGLNIMIYSGWKSDLAGLALCGGGCVDLLADAANCGQCGLSCGAAQVCAAGICTATCPADQAQCGQACVDLNSHILNCGTCGNSCLEGQVCEGGQCTGTPGDQSANDGGGSDDDSGCGCATPAARPRRLEGALGLLLGLVLLGRRRRRLSQPARPDSRIARTSL